MMTGAAAAIVLVGKLTVDLPIRERSTIGRRDATDRRQTVGCADPTPMQLSHSLEPQPPNLPLIFDH